MIYPDELKNMIGYKNSKCQKAYSCEITVFRTCIYYKFLISNLGNFY